MRRSDIIKILFVCVCVCHMSPAHPCGANPMRLIDDFSLKRGIDPALMLDILRNVSPANYSRLINEYRNYLACTQMVQNGYFKRSVDQPLIGHHSRQNQRQDLTDTQMLTWLQRESKQIANRPRQLNGYTLPDESVIRNPYDDLLLHDTKTVKEDSRPIRFKRTFRPKADKLKTDLRQSEKMPEMEARAIEKINEKHSSS